MDWKNTKNETSGFGKTADDWDNLEKKITELEAENQTLRIQDRKTRKIAMGIVSQLFDLAEVPVEKRQEINDIADDYIKQLELFYNQIPLDRIWLFAMFMKDWHLHSSEEYFYKSKNFNQWPPDETATKEELIKRFFEC